MIKAKGRRPIKKKIIPLAIILNVKPDKIASNRWPAKKNKPPFKMLYVKPAMILKNIWPAPPLISLSKIYSFK